MSDKPLDAQGINSEVGIPTAGKHDFIRYDDKQRKIDKFRLDRGETITLTFIATPVADTSTIN